MSAAEDYSANDGWSSGAETPREESKPPADRDGGLRRSAMRTANSILALQRRAEAELLQAQHALQLQADQMAVSNALLHTLLQSSPAGIMGVDRQGRITTFNTKLAELWGVSTAVRQRRDFMEWSGAFVLQADDALAVVTRLRHIVYASPEVEAQGVVVLQDGRALEYAAAPQQHDGQCTGVVFHWRDVTALRREAAEQERLQEQLRESQKMESLGALAGGIAHDFNNMLGAIIGNVMMATLSTDAAHPAQESLEAIRVASERASRLVQQILTFSRRQRQQVQQVSLASLLTEAVALLRATIPTGVQIVLDMDPTVPEVSGDPTQIHQVMMNLGTNAMHAVRERTGRSGGTGRIELRLRSVELNHEETQGPLASLTPGRYCVLLVSDDGVGMDAATRERMFEPFFTTRRTGTGLGLSVVHGILAAHGGALAVDTQLGVGTSFSLYFPVADSPSARDAAGVDERARGRKGTPPIGSDVAPVSLGEASRAQAIEATAKTSPFRTSLRVMVVDDEPMLVSISTRLLQRSGYQVSGFTESAPALDAIRANPAAFDVVLTDFNMPRMSGLEFAHAIHVIRPQMPIILASGFLSQELEDSAKDAGVDVVISKTKLSSELVQVVDRIVTQT